MNVQFLNDSWPMKWIVRLWPELLKAEILHEIMTICSEVEKITPQGINPPSAERFATSASMGLGGFGPRWSNSSGYFETPAQGGASWQ